MNPWIEFFILLTPVVAIMILDAHLKNKFREKNKRKIDAITERAEQEVKNSDLKSLIADANNRYPDSGDDNRNQ